MNLFLAGWSADGTVEPATAVAALEELLGELPFFPDRPVETWAAPSGRTGAAWVRHDDGLEYADPAADRLALFSGRPFLWTGDSEADGRAPVRAGFFASPPAGWREAIDGRFASIRCDGESLELVADALGAYPVYESERAGVRWLSNSAAALQRLTRDARLRPATLAGLVGGGWPLDGHPLWSAISRVEPGVALRLALDGERRERLLPLDELAALPGCGLDPERAAGRLVEATRALADWPGRPSLVPVTGGRDSRLVLAAARAADFAFESRTGGAPGEPDVEIGALLCRSVGVEHGLLDADPHGDMWSDHRLAARIVRLTSGGAATLADAAGFPLGPRTGPLPLWHSGQGGEIGRAYYGGGDGLDASGLTDRLYGAFSARRPHRPELLSAEGRELVVAALRAWVDQQLAAGVAPADVPDMFYLQRRMATWAAPTHGCVEYVRDTTSPLWSRRLLEDLLGPPAAQRTRELFHLRVLEQLAPALVEIPFAGGGDWSARQSQLERRLRRLRELSEKVARELRRRGRARVPGRGGSARAAPPPDRLDPILADVREQTLSHASHPAWDVLDRRRCERLLSQPAAALDEMSRYHVWRLATVFVE